jgi:hypothetical protein
MESFQRKYGMSWSGEEYHIVLEMALQRKLIREV